MNLKGAYIIVILALAFSSCKEEEKPEPVAPPPNPPGISLTRILGSQATLQATYFSTIVDSGFVGKITYIQGWGKASFKSINGAIIKPPRVAAEGVELTQRLGTYSNSPAGTQGIDFGSDIVWEVAATNLNPEINELIGYKVPEIGDVSLGDSLCGSCPLNIAIDQTNPFTNLGTVDSVSYWLHSTSASIVKKMGSLDSAQFSLEEIQSFGKGGAYLQVEAYRYEIKDYSGYKVAYINKGVFNKLIWIY